MLATQAAPAPRETALGPLPTSIGGNTVPLLALILVTLLPLSLVTQTRPPPTATASAPAPTGIVLVTVAVRGAIRTIVPSPESATQS